MTSKLIVGSEEWCSLPGIGIPAIKARVDSGAATSALHAFNIVPFQLEGIDWISFEVHPIQSDRSVVVRHEAEVLERRGVRNTSGMSETRYVIREELVLGDQSWPIELTLTNRDAMGLRMLLGREAMVGRVLVDPEGSHQLGDVGYADLEAMYAPFRQERTGLRIALLATDPELYSNRRLMEAGEERGHRMEFLNVKQCHMRLDPQSPERISPVR